MEKHRTIYYDLPALIVRRGFPLVLTITFNGEFDPSQNSLNFRIRSTTWPTSSEIVIPLGKTTNGWSVHTKEFDPAEKKALYSNVFQLISPVNAQIGKYSVS